MNLNRLALLVLIFALYLFVPSSCYIHRVSSKTPLQRSRPVSSSSFLVVYSKKSPTAKEEEKKRAKEEAELTQIGSKAYYKGFFTSDLQDSSINTSQRGDGLDQALKIGSYTAVFLGVLVVAFLASNGLI